MLMEQIITVKPYIRPVWVILRYDHILAASSLIISFNLSDNWRHNTVSGQFSAVRLQWLPRVPIGAVFLAARLLHRDGCYHFPDLLCWFLRRIHGELLCYHGGKGKAVTAFWLRARLLSLISYQGVPIWVRIPGLSVILQCSKLCEAR